ncbi:MAG: hypothetical protein V8S08_02040 [Lachnoclostridium sp.]
MAGYYAMRMGLPVHKLVCPPIKTMCLLSSLQAAPITPTVRFIKTMSPSMDILISSNLERLLFFELSGRDDAAVSAMMAQLKQKGEYSISAQMQER